MRPLQYLVLLLALVAACLASLCVAEEYQSELDCKKVPDDCVLCCMEFGKHADLRVPGACRCSLIPQELRDEINGRHEEMFGRH